VQQKQTGQNVKLSKVKIFKKTQRTRILGRVGFGGKNECVGEGEVAYKLKISPTDGL
jgi:hypothetical protein